MILSQSVFCSFLVSFSNSTPARARRINKLLNTRCPSQDSSDMMPPQLQGSSLLKVIIAPMYSVNATIRKREAYSPFNLQRGIINKMETRNSINGNPQAIKGATGFNMGDSEICSLKTEYSISLLIPVYKKSMIKRKAIISAIVVFDNQVNEIILDMKFDL
jgi:hypothetical protein